MHEQGPTTPRSATPVGCHSSVRVRAFEALITHNVYLERGGDGSGGDGGGGGSGDVGGGVDRVTLLESENQAHSGLCAGHRCECARAFEALKAHNVDLERVVGVRKELPAELPEHGRSTGGARSRPLEPATVDGLAAATLGGAHFGGFGGLFGLYYLETSPTFACFGQRLRRRPRSRRDLKEKASEPRHF